MPWKVIAMLAAAAGGYTLYAGNQKQFCLWKTNKKTGRSCVHTCSRRKIDLARDRREFTNKDYTLEIRPTSAFEVEHCD